MPIVDGWRVDQFSERQGKTKSLAFLTHAHRDHTYGLSAFLKREKDALIVCSEETAKIIEILDGVIPERCILVRPGDDISLDEGLVSVIDANHCIGSLMFHFSLNNKRYAVTGDFRANERILQAASEFSEPDVCYIDTTFDQVKFRFPSQARAITDAVKIAMRVEKDNKELLLGSYLVGKEKLFSILSHALQRKVYLSNPTQRKIYSVLRLEDFWTEDKDDTWISIVPMNALQRQKRMRQQQQLGRNKRIDHQMIASGWACLHQSNAFVSYIPYSEHNDFERLSNYRNTLKAKREVKIN